MRSLISHLRYTVRLLLKSPNFTVPAVLILGVGIGANTAIFSLVNGVLLKPLPYPKADRIMDIYETVPGFNKFTVDYPDYLDFSREQRSFESLAAYRRDSLTITGRGEPGLVSGVYTSGSLFQAFARPFLLGSPFADTDSKSETRPVVVISERLWRTRFQRDPNALGSTLLLNGRAFEIIGVTPPQGSEHGGIDVYLPLAFYPYFRFLETNRDFHGLNIVGRLKDTVTPQLAKTDLEAINQRLRAQYPATNTGLGIELIPYLDSVVGDYSASLWLLEATVGCLLLITSANVANLLLARFQERRREVSIRTALGASRKRLFIQLFLETLVLTLAGGILGLVLAFWGVHMIKLLCPVDVPRFQEIAVDNGALIFVLSITVCTALIAGVLPALASTTGELAPALAESGQRSGTAGPLRRKSQAYLVAGQVALTFVLLSAACLLLRSYQVLHDVPLGFNPRHILTGDIYFRSSKYSDTAKSRAALDAILDKLRRVPGVSGATLNDDLPFKGRDLMGFGVAGQPDPEPGQEPAMEPQLISGDYFSVLGIPLLRGRTFGNQDQLDKERVVIISKSIADHFFKGQDPIGRQLDDLGEVGATRHFYTIVGVVPDVEHNSPDSQHASFQAYFPYPQNPNPTDAMTVLLSVGQDPTGILPAVRKAIASIDPDLPFSNATSFDQLVENAYASRRLSMLVVSLFSGGALLLATVGLYAVLSHSVSQRGREIGVRIALGAETQNILRLVIFQGLRICMIGIFLGAFAAVILGHFVQGLLYQVSGTDPVTLLTAAGLLCLAALAACLLPAFRATRVNPIQALRE